MGFIMVQSGTVRKKDLYRKKKTKKELNELCQTEPENSFGFVCVISQFHNHEEQSESSAERKDTH